MGRTLLSAYGISTGYRPFRAQECARHTISNLLDTHWGSHSFAFFANHWGGTLVLAKPALLARMDTVKGKGRAQECARQMRSAPPWSRLLPEPRIVFRASRQSPTDGILADVFDLVCEALIGTKHVIERFILPERTFSS